jgi:hypothetical protein
LTVNIREVLSRRTDLSTFVVHLTRDRDAEWDAKRALLRIAELCLIRAITPMGWAANQELDERATQSQRVVCFSETPLEHVGTLVADIAGRQVRLQPWGVVLTKMTARANGVNPVWYVDQTPGRDWEIAHALDELRDDALRAGFADHPAAMIMPFFEPMGTWPTTGGQREFWWEREWRKRGDFSFRPEQVVSWIVPEADHDPFAEYMAEEWPHSPARCIDSTWSLEEIIAHLTDQSPINPFG